MSKKTKRMKTMDENVVNACEQIQTLKPQDSFHLLCEICEWMYKPLSEEIEEILLVPDFGNK